MQQACKRPKSVQGLGQGEGVGLNGIKELRRVINLSLHATRETAHTIGHSMAVMMATERRFWLNLSGIREKDKAFLLDAPLSPPGLFGDAVSSVIERFQRFIPHHHKSSVGENGSKDHYSL